MQELRIQAPIPMVTPARNEVGSATESNSLIISKVIGFLAFLSMICGGIVITLGFQNIQKVYSNELKVTLRLDPIVLKAKDPKFDGGLKNSAAIWLAAGISGTIAGLLQIGSSTWFIASSCNKENMNYKARLWILCQLISSFIILILMGAVFIACFEPDLMILGFGIDFIILYIFTLLSVPVIRREEKELMRMHKLGSGIGRKIPLLPTC